MQKILPKRFLACFVAYPSIYKNINNKTFAAILTSVAALQFGSIGVAVEGAISGAVINVPMLLSLTCGIHLAIGIAEGVFTAIVCKVAEKMNLSKIFSYSTAVIAFVLAGFISKYASTKPDGLEWSLLNLSNDFVAQTQGHIYAISETIQSHSAILSTIPNIFANVLGFATITVVALGVFSLMAYRSTVVSTNK